MIFELPDNTSIVTDGLIKESELSQYENILSTTLVEATIKDFSLLFRGGKSNLQADTFEKLYKVTFKPECGCEYTDKGFELETISGCGSLVTNKLEVGSDIWYIANVPNTNMAVVAYNGVFDITEHIDLDHDCIDIRTFKNRLYKPLKLNASGFIIYDEKIKLYGRCPEGSMQFLPGEVVLPASASFFSLNGAPPVVSNLINTTGQTVCYQLIYEKTPLHVPIYSIPYGYARADGFATLDDALAEFEAKTAIYHSYDSLKISLVGVPLYHCNPEDFFSFSRVSIFNILRPIMPGVDTIATNFKTDTWHAFYFPLDLSYQYALAVEAIWAKVELCTEE